MSKTEISKPITKYFLPFLLDNNLIIFVIKNIYWDSFIKAFLISDIKEIL